jgi:type VII secretion integral membrane protein EccD
MSDGFFSVTVVGGRRRLDLSLPADVPVADLLGELVAMLEEPAAGSPPSWGLVRVGGQVLQGEQGLAAQGVHAGSLLFLRDLADPIAPPAVDDYAGAVAAAIEEAPGLWTAAHFQGLLAAAGTAWLLALGAIAVQQVAGDVLIATPLDLLVAVMVTFGAGAIGRLAGAPRTGTVLAFAALPLWGAAGVGFARIAGLDETTAVAVGLAAVAAAALAARMAGREANAPSAGLVTATVPGAITLAVCVWRGVPLASGAAVLVPLLLAGVRLLPWAVTRLAGLEGRPGDARIERRAIEARWLLGALTAGAAVTLAAACVLLVLQPGSWAHAVAVAAALAALLQARRGRLIVDVVPMVFVALATLATFELPFVAVALLEPEQAGGPAVLVGTAAALVVLGLLGRHRRLPVGIRRQLGRAEALAAAATVPLALGMLGLYAAAQAFAARFA